MTRQQRARLARVLEHAAGGEWGLEDLLGPAWAGIHIRGRWLVLPGWRAGFDADELRALLYTSQRARGLEWEVKRLGQELERAHEALQAAERHAAWARHQLRTEARFGGLLGALAGLSG